LSWLTTIKRIDELTDREILRDEKEKHSYHRLYINQDNEFNKIFKALTEIEFFIDKFGEELQRIDKLHDTLRDMDLKGAPRKELMGLVTDLQDNFVLPYYNTTRTAIRLIFTKILSRINSEEDAQLLHTKSFKLLQKLSLQFWGFGYSESKAVSELGKLISNYTHGKTDYFETYARNTKKKNIDINLLDELMESLKKNFFSET